MRLLIMTGILGLTLSLFTPLYAEAALTADDVKKMVLERNQSVKMAYEKLFQSRQQVKVAIANFLPRINLISLSTAMVGIWTSLKSIYWSKDVLYSAPTNWFNYRSSKYMALAEKYVLEAIKLNIQKEVALLYYNILLDEGSLAILQDELAVILEQMTMLQTEVDLGQSDGKELVEKTKEKLSLEKSLVLLENMLVAERSALKNLLFLSPGQEVLLAPITVSLNDEIMNKSVEEYVQIALERSPEVKEAGYLIQAAQKKRTAAVWSFIGFSGIGFDYFSQIRIGNSQVRAMRSNRDQMQVEIQNQTFTAYHNIFDAFLQEKLERKHLALNEELFTREQTYYDLGKTDLHTLLNAKMLVVRDRRNVHIAKFNSYVKREELERLIGERVNADTSTITQPENLDNLKIHSQVRKKFRWYHHSLQIEGNLEGIESVTYTLANSRLKPKQITNPSQNYKWSFRSKKRSYTVTALVRYSDGSEKEIF